MAAPYGYSPACWNWPVPTEADWARIREGIRAQYMAAADLLTEDKAFLVHEWQAGRCAVCGREERLVEDHDHGTGLFRGWLCRSCNVSEGMNPGTGYQLWREYRERSPATICGVAERYWNPFTKAFAEPAPPYDPWKDNPMRNVGL